MLKREGEATCVTRPTADKTYPVCSALQRLVERFYDLLVLSDLKSLFLLQLMQLISFRPKPSRNLFRSRSKKPRYNYMKQNCWNIASFGIK